MRAEGYRNKKRGAGRVIVFAFFLIPVLLGINYYGYSNRDKNKKTMIDVPYISQKNVLETGCELVSATMVMQFYGYDITVEDFVKNTPQSQLKETESGCVGKDPSQSFIGDPHSSSGFGCYAPVITSVMNSFFQNKSKKAVNVTGTKLEDLLRTYIDHNSPVLVWATSNMKQPQQGKSWTIESTGKTFQWIAGEHCLVLVGYDDNLYYFNDPYDSNGIIGYDKELVEKRYRALGSQAVAVTDL